MNLTAELKATLLDLIDSTGPTSYRELIASPDVQALVVDEKQVTNLLYNLKRSGAIALDNDRQYYIPAGEEAEQQAEAIAAAVYKPCAASSGTERLDTEAPAEAVSGPDEGDDCTWYSEARVLELLEEQERVAQDALDRYLMQVGDPTIIDCLRAPRDSARAAIDAITEAEA